MLDFNHILSTPGYDLQQFIGTASATLGTGSGGQQLQTWRKPRGVNWVYIIGVGGGGGGSTGGRGGSTTAGGGGGGGSGGQTTVLIPASMIPDTLYILCGAGGAGSTVSGAATGVVGNNGIPTYVLVEPDTTLTINTTLLLTNGGSAGGVEATGGSVGGVGGTLAAINNMPLAGRGTFNFFAGQTGGTGGSRAGVAPTAIALPQTGLLVSGGQGGGGGGTTPTAGVGFTNSTGALGQDFFPNTVAGAVASGATPATAGSPGFISKNFLMNYGGSGGGGSNATTGGNAANGGDAAPGCGGGGAGAINLTNTTAVTSGAGGAGFVYIISW
jgi:hypothetical protein